MFEEKKGIVQWRGVIRKAVNVIQRKLTAWKSSALVSSFDKHVWVTSTIHSHHQSLSKRRLSKVWIFHDDAWLDSRGWFCLYLPACHFCLQLYRISAIAKSVKSQNETRHKRRKGKDLGCQRLKKKPFWIDLENFLFGWFQKC